MVIIENYDMKTVFAKVCLCFFIDLCNGFNIFNKQRQLYLPRFIFVFIDLCNGFNILHKQGQL